MAETEQDLQEQLTDLGADHPSVFAPAMHWLGQHPDVSRPALLALARGGAEDLASRRAFEVLGRIGDPRDVPAMLQALQAARGSLAWDAALGLASHPDPSARKALETATRSPQLDVARSAISALGVRKDEGARPALEEALKNGDASARFRAVGSLVQLGAGGSRAALEALLQHEPDEDTRAVAARALGR